MQLEVTTPEQNVVIVRAQQLELENSSLKEELEKLRERDQKLDAQFEELNAERNKAVHEEWLLRNQVRLKEEELTALKASLSQPTTPPLPDNLKARLIEILEKYDRKEEGYQRNNPSKLIPDLRELAGHKARMKKKAQPKKDEVTLKLETDSGHEETIQASS